MVFAFGLASGHIMFQGRPQQQLTLKQAIQHELKMQEEEKKRPPRC